MADRSLEILYHTDRLVTMVRRLGTAAVRDANRSDNRRVATAHVAITIDGNRAKQTKEASTVCMIA
jgi:hypothetical protein